MMLTKKLGTLNFYKKISNKWKGNLPFKMMMIIKNMDNKSKPFHNKNSKSLINSQLNSNNSKSKKNNFRHFSKVILPTHNKKMKKWWRKSNPCMKKRLLLKTKSTLNFKKNTNKNRKNKNKKLSYWVKKLITRLKCSKNSLLIVLKKPKKYIQINWKRLF